MQVYDLSEADLESQKALNNLHPGVARELKSCFLKVFNGDVPDGVGVRVEQCTNIVSFHIVVYATAIACKGKKEEIVGRSFASVTEFLRSSQYRLSMVCMAAEDCLREIRRFRAIDPEEVTRLMDLIDTWPGY